MVIQDDRTHEQRQTHVWAVVARDRAMSGWGGATGGHSRCAWACASLHDAEQKERWVRGRSEMRNVAIQDLRTYRVPRGTAHFHIYVVADSRPKVAAKCQATACLLTVRYWQAHNVKGKPDV